MHCFCLAGRRIQLTVAALSAATLGPCRQLRSHSRVQPSIKFLLAMHPRFLVRVIYLFAIGCLTGTQLQHVAAGAWYDGRDRNSALLHSLAFAGNRGAHTGNCLRDIIRACRRAGLLGSVQPYYFEAPGADGIPIRLQCFLPHEELHAQVQANGLEPFTLAKGDVSPMFQLLQNWVSHRDVSVRHDVHRVIGVGVHGDGAQYTSSIRAGEGKTMYALSWNVVSGRTQAIKGKRHLFCVIGKNKLCTCGCGGFCTFQAIFEVFSWSMRCLMLGVSPRRRHEGAVWTDADRSNRLPANTELPPAALMQVRGDWEWFATGFHLRSPSAEHFCYKCEATKSPGVNCYKNFSARAPHRQTRITHHEFLLSCSAARMQPTTLLRCPGSSLDMWLVDSMHCADLGVFADSVGSLLYLHATHKPFFRNHLLGLAALNRELEHYFAANRDRNLTPTSKLTWSQIKTKNPGYPMLKAKAAQIRHLTEYCYGLANRHFYGDPRPGGFGQFKFRDSHPLAGVSAEHANLVRMLFAAQKRYTELIVEENFNPDLCKDAMYAFLGSFKRLHDLWRRALPEDTWTFLPWHIRPKHHLFQHLIDDLRIYGSPAGFWCYGHAVLL